ncbi:transcription initiation factor TFIID subunit 3 [Lutzomyia longipalpis]|uniref:transcription initiation factor TFIID subunit 3 n=1 Tax=Lutzomyia longipalpis TaxID=7200 RepID=UPI0024843CEC|nr:transcription initiation factor TFIID subunit 3 [Lutzomyia longipalpis]
MSEAYSHQVLRTVVAQICQTIGWHSIQSGTLDILVDTAKRYIQALGRDTHRFTELAQRTEPNLDDLERAFADWQVNYDDIVEYVRNVSPEECAIKVPKYPAKKENHLNFLKPGSKEVITRPVHIPEYMPPILPEEEDGKVAEKENQRSRDEIDVVSLSPRQATAVKVERDFVPPAPVPRARFSAQAEDEMGRSVRENSSVIMTTSGFISPSRAGKAPDAKLSVDVADLIQQLVGPEAAPLPQKPFLPPSHASKAPPEPKDNPLAAPIHAAPSPLNIASANPDKFDVKVKGRKGDRKEGAEKPRQKNKPHRAKEGPTRKAHTSKKAMREAQEQQIRPPAPEMPLPMDLVTVKKPPDEPPEVPIVEGKISAEPDKLKMNIFKRISTKGTGVKEEKSMEGLPDSLPFVPGPELTIRAIPATPESPVQKKRQNPSGRSTEPKERKKPRTEKVSKKQKMQLNPSPMADNAMRFDGGFQGDFHQPPIKQETSPGGIPPMFPPQQPSPRASAHNLFNLFNFSSSPGLIPPPALFGNPFGLHPQQPPGGLPFPPGMRAPNPFNIMPLPRFPPINPPAPPTPPALPESLLPQSPPDRAHCNVAPLVPESLKLEPLVLNMSTTPPVEPKDEPVVIPDDDEEEAKRRKMEKKVKKKKEKKEKTKDKEKKREEKRALKEAMKVSKAKEKREKKKERERLEREGAFKEENMTSIPKLTLKLGAAHSPNPPSPEGGRKLTIKPIKREPAGEADGGEMPELARISPLVTRPPKPKSPPQSGYGFFQHSPTGAGIPSSTAISGTKGFPPSLATQGEHIKSPTTSLLTPLPIKGRPRGSGSKQHTATLSAAPAVPTMSSSGLNMSVETSLLPEKLPNNSMRDADGNQVWICPACGRVDDGTPMIGCDGCDAWYHWVCVGIQVPPDATEDWYCRVCIVKKQEMQAGGGGGMEKKKKRKKREKKQQQV